MLLHPTPYIYSLLLTAVAAGSKVGIPRGRYENHNFVIAFIGVLDFDFFISLCFTLNNRRRGALARVSAHIAPLLHEKLI